MFLNGKVVFPGLKFSIPLNKSATPSATPEIQYCAIAH